MCCIHLPHDQTGSRSGQHLDDAVGNALLLTQGWQPDDQLDGINVVRNDDKLGLARLDELSDVVEPILDNDRLLLVGILYKQPIVKCPTMFQQQSTN